MNVWIHINPFECSVLPLKTIATISCASVAKFDGDSEWRHMRYSVWASASRFACDPTGTSNH